MPRQSSSVLATLSAVVAYLGLAVAALGIIKERLALQGVRSYDVVPGAIGPVDHAVYVRLVLAAGLATGLLASLVVVAAQRGPRRFAPLAGALTLVLAYALNEWSQRAG